MATIMVPSVIGCNVFLLHGNQTVSPRHFCRLTINQSSEVGKLGSWLGRGLQGATWLNRSYFCN